VFASDNQLALRIQELKMSLFQTFTIRVCPIVFEQYSEFGFSNKFKC